MFVYKSSQVKFQWNITDNVDMQCKEIFPNLIKDELPAEGDGGKEDSLLLIPWAEDDGLPIHVLGYCVGAEEEAETGQHQVEDDP